LSVELADDLGDLLAKKFGAAGCWMANAVRVNTKLLELRGGDFSGSKPIFSNAPQTIVAVGSEKPSGQTLGLLVRRGLMPERICSGSLRPTSPGTWRVRR